MSATRCGIVSYGTGDTLDYLPLEELRARVQIVDVSARVTLTQIYSNSTDLPTRRAKYMFPIPAGAAIAGFELTISDGTHLIGQCKDREVATSEYQRAVASGRSAGILDYVTDDIFVISVGAIPSGETAETKLVYVTSLQNDDILNSLRFSLPTYVGQRYGTPPTGIADAASPSTKTRIRVTVDIQTGGQIQSIYTPDYAEHVTIKRTHQDGRPSEKRATIKLRNPNYLHKEFVVICSAEKLDTPRCFAELIELDGAHSLALQLTLIPKYDLPPIPSQEYIFLIDRSGSMAGDPMDKAKKTASTLIHLLPKDGTFFNVFVFDSVVGSMWPHSVQYNAASLHTIDGYVNNIASQRGTEIGTALRTTLASRNSRIPTAMFVLTDGGAFDINGTAAIVREAVERATPEAHLKVFTLGIGTQVSTDMCDAIALAGNGDALYSRTGKGIIGQSRRLLQAGKAQSVEDISVDWGVSSTHLARPTISRRRSTSQPSSIVDLPVEQQSPPHVLKMNAESRIYVYAIISLRKPFLPRKVTLTGTVTNRIQSSDFVLEVPVRIVKMPDGDPQIHSLAAWKLIQDHQRAEANIPPTLNSMSPDEIHKTVIIKLGERYQVASKFTSFVAVESLRARSRANAATVPTNSQPSISQLGPLPGIFGAVQSLFSSFFNASSRHSSRRHTPSSGVPGAFPISQTVSRASTADSGSSGSSNSSPSSVGDGSVVGAHPPPLNDDTASIASDASAETFSTMSSLNLSDWSDWSEDPRPRRRLSRIERDRIRSPSPFRNDVANAPPDIHAQLVAQRREPTPEPPAQSEVDPQVYEILQKAEFDGSFDLGTAQQFVAANIVQAQPTAGTDGATWATALCVAFLLKKIGSGDTQEILAKSLQFLDSKKDGKELLKRAKAMLKD